MEKQFESIAELVKDQIFIEYVEKRLNALRAERNTRPEPKKGFRYVRDWYDSMSSENQLNADFFLKNIEAIWNKKSNLSSEKRQIVQYVCDQALYQMNEYYANLPEGNMTKEEAINAMKQGKKITHANFSPDEWMTMENSEILLEDNVRCSENEFWDFRTSESWNEGYSIWNEKIKNEPAEQPQN